ncbi:Bug family tripartite tricarboxylate transporter substrate binding protein [Pseudorhodoferax sp.]|uniref:Bug family tripartite tricarboxylate transporter substrate binding protein n=1 Tax=Pseudorhodoferax sp. TaxID=1993553 RepID=UPI0039E3CD36
MPTTRRHAVGCAIAALAFCAPGAFAESPFPSHPLTLVVPYPPGGAADGHMRVMAEAAAKHLGQPVTVVNRPGASGTMGIVALQQTPSDGHVVALWPTTAFRLPYLQKVPWDPMTDVSYVINVTGFAYGLVVRADAPWHNLAELLADAKANPGTISFGTPGAMTVPHLATEELFAKAGGKATHVPFKGYSDAATALGGGHIHMLVDAPSWAGMVETGKFKLLGTFAPQRLARWPDVPTVRESGYDIVATAPYGLVTGKDVPPAQVQVLHDAFRKSMGDPAYQASMDNLMQVSAYLGPQEYKKWAQQYMKEQKDVLERLGYLVHP